MHLVMQVVMLNMIIAILSDSYNEVAQVEEESLYYRRACIIQDNNYVVSRLVVEQKVKNYD